MHFIILFGFCVIENRLKYVFSYKTGLVSFNINYFFKNLFFILLNNIRTKLNKFYTKKKNNNS